MTTPLTKQFEIGPVVTVLYGDPDKIFCTLRDLYDILGFITGDIPSHSRNTVDGADSIDEAMTKAAKHLAELFPDLAAEDVPNFFDPTDPTTEAEIVGWLVELGVKHHAPFTVTQLPDVTRAAHPPAEEGTPA